jgi:hypothetical protein
LHTGCLDGAICRSIGDVVTAGFTDLLFMNPANGTIRRTSAAVTGITNGKSNSGIGGNTMVTMVDVFVAEMVASLSNGASDVSERLCMMLAGEAASTDTSN